MDTTDNINIRYGESLKLSTTLDSDMENISSLTFYIGLEGELMPLEVIEATFYGGIATVFKESITLPLGNYKYQYTAIYNDGTIEKFPSIDACSSYDSSSLPTFTVHEALDIVEIS